MPTNAAIEVACNVKLHRSFLVPATQAHPDLRVTYSIAGPDVSSDVSSDKVPTMLLIGGMFGGRYMTSGLENLALRTGVRVIGVDRPGLGGSTYIPISQRLNAWLEMVPCLLAHLNIQHVALAAHSVGTVYCLNTVLQLPHILHPQRPYVVLLAPWIHPAQSGKKLMKAAMLVPTAMMSGWSDLNRFIRQRIVPTVAWSSGLSNMAGIKSNSEEESIWRASVEELYGHSWDEIGETSKLLSQYILAEDMSGGNDEALICLKKTDVMLWGACEDYKEFVKMLAQKLAQQGQKHLKVQTFFADSDMLIGKKGQDYFVSCWDADLQENIHFESYVVAGTDHDSVCAPEYGAMKSILEETKKAFSQN